MLDQPNNIVAPQTTYRDATGGTRTGGGKFAVVLRRQPDGRWQFAVDAYNQREQSQ